jgi:hypothetical protein
LVLPSKRKLEAMTSSLQWMWRTFYQRRLRKFKSLNRRM